MELKLFRGDQVEELEPISRGEQNLVSELLAAYVRQVKSAGSSWWVSSIQPKEYAAGRDILAAKPQVQVAITDAALTLLARHVHADGDRDYALRALLQALLRRNLPFDEQTVLHMLTIAETCVSWEIPVGSIISASAKFAQRSGLTAEMGSKLKSLSCSYHLKSDYAEQRTIGKRIAAILDSSNALTTPKKFELNSGEPWTDALLVELGQLEDADRHGWHLFLDHCRTAKSSKPSKKWLKQAQTLASEIGPDTFARVVCSTLAAIGKSGTSQKRNHGGWTHFTEPSQIHDTHIDLLRGLVWSTSLVDNESLVGAVGDAAEKCFQKVPNVGPRCPKIGNACLQTLSTMTSLAAVSQLGRLKSRAKHASTRKQIANALERAAAKSGMTAEDLEEIAVPTFDLTELGRATEPLGEFTAEMIIKATGKPDLVWIKTNGKRQKTVPAAVKSEYADELRAIKKKSKEIATLMPSLRYRVERLLLNERSWSYVDFRRRFLDHPLVSVIARRVIWNFESNGNSAAGFCVGDAFVDTGDASLDWISDQTTVSIWHPAQATADEVLRWRTWLEAEEVVQPFKQAHREVYLLTDAERETRTYSNRFAAHIIRQHQLMALCQQRGWQYRVQGDWDSSNAPFLELPQHDLRVEFWVDPIENLNQRSEALVFLYLSTDQVRFSRVNGAGPIPLEEIPPRVCSEVMRDVDLFVGVASVGNDPNWVDGGPEGMYQEYWHDYAFGDLSQTASTRKEVLQRVLPRLKIASQCSLEDKFLVVNGRIRTYKIHLGSGNIMMLPNDQYLCIVPKRGGGTKRTDGIYLPFEGDDMLSVILSKAFLLADDHEITDASIVHQIGKSQVSRP